MIDDDPEFALRLPFDYDDKANAEDAREALLRASENPSFWVDFCDGIEGTRAVSEFLAICVQQRDHLPFWTVHYALSHLIDKAVNGAGDD